ncbi:DNA-3-methyladenine glycosylase [Spirochaetota bacterium]
MEKMIEDNVVWSMFSLAPHTFTIQAIPPFRLDLTTWILRRRPNNQIDRWDGQAYHRVLMLDDKPFAIKVTQPGSPETALLEVSLYGVKASAAIEARVTADLERLLGIHSNLEAFYRFAEGHPRLESLVAPFRGAKPPRFLSLFETLNNAIACQQLSLTVGIILLNRLSQAYGPLYRNDASTLTGTCNAFPRPQDMAGADLEELRSMGFSRKKGQYLCSLSGSMLEGQVDLDEIATLNDTDAIEHLCRIHGVGRWTAEYFLLRGLGRTHIFPGDDVGARNNLQHWLDLPQRLDYQGVKRALSGCEDYGGLIYFHLLLKSLTEKGIAVV